MLKDHPNGPEWIKTLTSRGYSLFEPKNVIIIGKTGIITDYFRKLSVSN